MEFGLRLDLKKLNEDIATVQFGVKVAVFSKFVKP
jgi:hypothetical protein